MKGDLAAALSLAGTAFVVGLSGAMPPGSFLTATVARTLKNGPRSAAMMLVGHAVLEAVLLVGFAFGLHQFLARQAVHAAISMVGGAFLLWMGLDLVVSSLRGSIRLEVSGTRDSSQAGPIVSGAAVSFSNPYWTLWWATVGVKLALDGLSIGPLGVAAFFIGHELADVAWYGLIISAVHAGRRLLSDKAYRIMIGACAVFLVYLGARFLLDGIGIA